jgi:hypothetical protein
MCGPSIRNGKNKRSNLSPLAGEGYINKTNTNNPQARGLSWGDKTEDRLLLLHYLGWYTPACYSVGFCSICGTEPLVNGAMLDNPGLK